MVIALENGAQMVTVGSIAAQKPELFLSWLERFGSDKMILGADVKGEKISTNGWMQEDGQELLPYLEFYLKKGVHKVLCTDISKDGMLEGPAVSLYERILNVHPSLYLIASGGVSSIQDILTLDKEGVQAVVFGKAIYEGHITLKDLNKLMAEIHKDNVDMLD